MADCIFCKIAKKEIPSNQIYEDEDFFGFLDIRPRNPGHTLIIPKKHYRWVWDVEEEYSKVVNKIARALKKAMETELVISIVLGEEVEHAHSKAIPNCLNVLEYSSDVSLVIIIKSIACSCYSQFRYC